MTYIVTKACVATVRDEPLRDAFVRLGNQQALYRESDAAVTFLTPNVFRYHSAAGQRPDQQLCDRRQAVRRRRHGRADELGDGSDQNRIRTIRAGAAHDYGLLYGLVATLMALLTG